MTGEQLSNIRTRLGLSVPEMARLLGLTIRTYYRQEQARRIRLTVDRLLVTLLKTPDILWADVAGIRGGSNETK